MNWNDQGNPEPCTREGKLAWLRRLLADQARLREVIEQPPYHESVLLASVYEAAMKEMRLNVLMPRSVLKGAKHSALQTHQTARRIWRSRWEGGYPEKE